MGFVEHPFENKDRLSNFSRISCFYNWERLKIQAVDSVGQSSSTTTFNENVEEKDTSMTERWLKGAGISPVSALLYSTLGDMLWISYL